MRRLGILKTTRLCSRLFRSFFLTEFLPIVLIPAKKLIDPANDPSDAGSVLLDAIKHLAIDICGENLLICALYREKFILYKLQQNDGNNTIAIALHKPQDLKQISKFLSSKFVKLHFRGFAFFNTSFFLSDQPDYAGLICRTKQLGLSISALRSSGDIYAAAFLFEAIKDKWPIVNQLLRCLTITIDDAAANILPELSDNEFVTPSSICIEKTPALEGIKNPIGLPAHDAPRYLNTALQEILFCPVDKGSVENDPLRMKDVLLQHRNNSRVPWIFNELLNVIEYRVGSTKPCSFPPEIHLSMTGACNLSCKFCSYTKDIVRFDYITQDQLMQLDFLSNIRALRLSSGLGEPTMNPNLRAIIDYVGKQFPHIAMNFFTNGVLLNRPHLIPSLVANGIHWINVSVNSINRQTWHNISGADHFDRVCDNLAAILQEKKIRHSIHPLIYGSIVLTRRNINELPKIPEFCRKMGIDRFTAFPFSSYGYGGQNKYGSEEAYHHERDRYEDIYRQTIKEAEAHHVSLELPIPRISKKENFDFEIRPFYDFAQIESNDWRLEKLLSRLHFSHSPGAHCFFLWRQAGIGSTNKTLGEIPETHYIYPCLGPLSGLNYANTCAVSFSGTQDFISLWQNPLFTILRNAQHKSGICAICDLCRNNDTRDPRMFDNMSTILDPFVKTHNLQTV